MKLSLLTLVSLQQFPKLCKVCAQTLFRSFSANLQESSSNETFHKYSANQQKIILRVLNESSLHDLSRFNVTERRAELLNAFRTKSGQFKSLDQVLEVNGIGHQGIASLFTSILEKLDGSDGCVTESGEKTTVKKSSSKRTALLIPTLETEQIRTLETVVGIHIGFNVITWAMIDKTNRLIDWNLHELKLDTKKNHPTALLSQVLQVRSQLPSSDVYIMEDSPSSNLPSKQQVTSLTMQLRKSQLSSMMLAVLNTKQMQNDSEDILENRNRVYYLRYRTPARLFRTIVGSERVSAQLLVEDIISPPLDKMPPDHYTPLRVDGNLRLDFASRTKVDRESMCQALLLTMAFMDLVIYRTPQSLRVIGK